MADVTCKKCGSSNVTFQRETTATVGGAKHTIKKGHGIIYWVCIGWWWKPLIIISTCGLSLLHKKKAKATTVSASKNINRTMAVCQDCGYSWKA